jgi:hypothetical protein
VNTDHCLPTSINNLFGPYFQPHKKKRENAQLTAPTYPSNIKHPPPIMPLTIDHTTLVVPASNLNDIVQFLLATLEPLGLREWMRPTPTSVGLGDKTPFFWVTGVEGDEETLRAVMRCEHFAFSAGSKFRLCLFVVAEQVRLTGVDVANELVDAFYQAAIKAGGEDNGAPGPRPQYHPGYYAAYVKDPVCGINIEVVNHNTASYA